METTLVRTRSLAVEVWGRAQPTRWSQRTGAPAPA